VVGVIAAIRADLQQLRELWSYTQIGYHCTLRGKA
jgi:hypothetical protein